TVIGHNAAKMLETLIFILDGAFQPVFAIQIDNYAALVKAMMAFGEFCFDGKGKEFLLCAHLQHRSVVVAKMVIGSLPQIGMRPGDDLDPILGDHAALGLSCPLQPADIKFHDGIPPGVSCWLCKTPCLLFSISYCPADGG